jgi:hypothetical protein
MLILAVVLIAPAPGGDLSAATLLHAFVAEVVPAGGAIVHQGVGFGRRFGPASFASIHISITKTQGITNCPSITC